MLDRHKDRICAFFAVDYELKLGAKLEAAAEAIVSNNPPTRTGFGAQPVYDFQWPDERRHLMIGSKRLGVETLGLDAWLDNQNEHMKVTSSALSAMEADELGRIGFKVAAYLPLSMTHAEMSDLMFGSFLCPKDNLPPDLGSNQDPLVLLEGETEGMNYVLQFSPLTTLQASKHFLAMGNLDRFVQNRFVDTVIKEFHDRISSTDCLLYDIDIFKQNIDSGSVRAFARDAYSLADKLATSCVNHLKSIPVESNAT